MSEEQPIYAEATAVAGLAREVEGLRRGVEPLRGLPGQVEDLARVVTELAERVAASTRRNLPSGAPSWLDLPQDLQLAQDVLADLVEWLAQVYLRYADAVKSFPDCWLWHPDVVEELLWLMATWTAVYRDDQGTAALAGDWHDRYRPGVVRRIKTVAGTCSLDNHRARAGRPVVPLAEAMAPLAAWWAQDRDRPAPAPTDEQLAADTTRTARRGGRR